MVLYNKWYMESVSGGNTEGYIIQLAQTQSLEFHLYGSAILIIIFLIIATLTALFFKNKHVISNK